VALGGGDGGRLCSESPAVLVGTGAYLQRLGGTVVGYGGMDSVVGPAAALDAGLTACRAALGDSRRGRDRQR